MQDAYIACYESYVEWHMRIQGMKEGEGKGKELTWKIILHILDLINVDLLMLYFKLFGSSLHGSDHRLGVAHRLHRKRSLLHT